MREAVCAISCRTGYDGDLLTRRRPIKSLSMYQSPHQPNGRASEYRRLKSLNGWLGVVVDEPRPPLSDRSHDGRHWKGADGSAKPGSESASQRQYLGGIAVASGKIRRTRWLPSAHWWLVGHNRRLWRAWERRNRRSRRWLLWDRGLRAGRCRTLACHRLEFMCEDQSEVPLYKVYLLDAEPVRIVTQLKKAL
jgi:hypothetical protein